MVTQSQQQIQSVHIQILLDLQSKIDEKIPHYPENSNEKSFLKKLKGSLSRISNITQLINQLLKTAKDFGIDMDELIKMFT